MAYLNDSALDAGLAYVITNGTRLELCSSEPANYAGIAAVALANKPGITCAAASNGPTSGRKTTTPAVTDGTVTGTGTATHWALHNGSSTLVASGALASSQSMTSGNTFTLGAITINLLDAISV